MNLARNNDNNKIAIAAKGGIEAITAALNAHRSSENVQQNGCWALANLADAPGNQIKIAAEGGVEAIVAAMNAHRNSENVQHYGCSALCHITCSDANIIKKVKSTPGLIDALMAEKTGPLPAAKHADLILARLSEV